MGAGEPSGGEHTHFGEVPGQETLKCGEIFSSLHMEKCMKRALCPAGKAISCPFLVPGDKPAGERNKKFCFIGFYA